MAVRFPPLFLALAAACAHVALACIPFQMQSHQEQYCLGDINEVNLGLLHL